MLNIKNPETHRLARELAARRGESLTTAVTVALREQLAREPVEPPSATVEDIMALVRSIQPHLTPLEPGEDPTAFLYDDETGLPG
ncbi:type II toxin-antitoxin system VapB family antitoxin [Brevundimonas subvibrioides]|uniref:type II toxin-antitoxin system VapB family antitoxin n=1 Tax=Brevundimonas subvibrioides TaxID=74313 RepID=UPI0022B5B200|nr:type II toxin-antitoxin system VapB family antitoxin [Brevundimonas subvibrioides]